MEKEAEGSPDLASPAVDPGELADLGDDRCLVARLRLLAESVPRRGRQAAQVVLRDAWVPAGDCERAGRHDHRTGGQSSSAPPWRIQVRHLAYGASHPGPAHGQVPA